jgi:hypothetical protein
LATSGLPSGSSSEVSFCKLEASSLPFVGSDSGDGVSGFLGFVWSRRGKTFFFFVTDGRRK